MRYTVFLAVLAAGMGTFATMNIFGDVLTEKQPPVCSELMVRDICAKTVKTDCLDANTLHAQQACINQLKVDQLCGDI